MRKDAEAIPEKKETGRKSRKKQLFALIIALFHIMGAGSSVHAIMCARTSQGAIAWAVSLNTFPYVAVPAYWVFGRNRFQGYVVARQDELKNISGVTDQILAATEPFLPPE